MVPFTVLKKGQLKWGMLKVVANLWLISCYHCVSETQPQLHLVNFGLDIVVTVDNYYQALSNEIKYPT